MEIVTTLFIVIFCYLIGAYITAIGNQIYYAHMATACRFCSESYRCPEHNLEGNKDYYVSCIFWPIEWIICLILVVSKALMPLWKHTSPAAVGNKIVRKNKMKVLVEGSGEQD